MAGIGQYLLSAVAEEVGVLVRSAGPQIPQLIAKRILHKLPAVVVVVGVVARLDARRQRIDVVLGVKVLRREEAEVLSPKESPESRRVASRLERLSVHDARDDVRVFHDDAQLAVVVPLLAAVVEVARAANHHSIVGDEQLGVDVELFLDPVLHLGLGIRLDPRLVFQGRLVGHGMVRDGSRRPDLFFRLGLFENLLCLVGLVARLFSLAFSARVVASPALRGAGRPVDAFAHDVFGKDALDFPVRDARLLLGLGDGRGLVQPVVRPQVEEEDVLGGIDPLVPDLLEDGVLSPAYRPVLVIHDGPGAGGGVVSEVARKPGDRGDDDDDPEPAALPSRPDHGVGDGLADGVVDRGLVLAGGGDEELVLDVDVVLRGGDHLRVCGLDGPVRQDSARPVGAGPHNLRADGPPVEQVLGAEGGQGVLHVAPHRVLGPLHPDQVFVLALAALEDDPVEPLVALVLVALDKVPPQDEVLGNVVHARADDGHGDVVPGHAAVVCLAELVVLPVLHLFEVHDSVVVEVLARPDVRRHLVRVDVGERVVPGVPPPKAEIQAADEGDGVVDDDELLVVSPVHRHVGGVLQDVVVRVPHDLDVVVPRRAFRTEGLQGVLGVFRVAGQGGFDLLVDDDEDFDSLLRLALQNLVQPVLLFLMVSLACSRATDTAQK
ncbi:hypothetical protein Trco_004117 [Trichoderma cornu-damae]|uniref:Uncharacterized protein n=1 Tax=Trichoderma cornu-damae TaxID=654480 RepID=A0A9P8TWM0_9HYPO|nr:hypothetical protein Trco_004117 [Trichoderma cornu-damae]